MRTFLIVTSAAIFLASLLCWGWLAGMGAFIGVPPPQLTPSLTAYLLPAAGVGAGLSIGMLVFLFSSYSRPREPAVPEANLVEGAERAVESVREAKPPARPQADRAALLLGISIASLVILLLVAAAVGRIEPVPAVLIIICGTLTLFAGMHVVEGLARGETIEISSHWGGLGGSMGGWRLSPIGTLLVVALILLGATIAASGAFSGLAKTEKAEQDSNTTATTPPTVNQRRPAPRQGAAGNQQNPAGNDAAAANAVAGNAL